MKTPPRQFLAFLSLLIFLAVFESANAQVYISEFLADNQTNAKVDEDGNHSDWIELWNSGASAVSLNGWYLTDDSGDLRKWQFPVTTPVVSLAANARLIVFASNKNRRLDSAKLHTNFKLAKNAGSFLALVRTDGLTIEHAYNNYPQQVQDIAYGITVLTQTQTLVAAGAAGRAKVPTSAADFTASAGWNTSPTFDDSAWQAGQSGFGYDTTGSISALIGAGGNLQSSMYLVNSTALVRFVFNVADPAAISSLKLSLKFDDGFNCYLNGQLIQQSFSGGTAWNSPAVSDRLGSLTGTYAVFAPANAQQRLVAGANVLAFQMLNSSNGSVVEYDSANSLNGSRALCLPLLEGTAITGIGPAAYLASATPGTVNSAALTALGPSISATTDTPARPVGGVGSAPIVINTKVVPSLKPLAAANPVQLKYRIMFNAESSVNMKDDGIAPDAIAGDTIFTGQIPTTTMTAGQMVRWRVVATDNAAASIADPPYRDIADNDQYYGTVAADGLTTSALPILHWFISDADLTTLDTDNFVRASFFFLGRFYDNVRCDRHGQSTAGFPKKSYNFNFNQDNKFKWQVGQSQIGAINLLTNWADKTKVRNQVAWETWQNTGHIGSHWSQAVRLQKNGVFHATYDMTENGDEDFLTREGLDPHGALYKVYNSLENVNISNLDGNGVEKKTGFPLTDVSDLAALETATDPATKTLANRRQYAYDNVDMTAFINYMAVNVIILNNDFGHKNYYIYRDTNGTREWSLMPWDQDLSFGHTWTGSQNYFNDDIDSQRGLIQGAAAGNRLMNFIMNSPGANTLAPEMVQMFLRRLRTLTDRYYIAATATDGPIEQRMNQLVDQFDPPGAAFLTDADLDLQKWGYWTDGNGAQISPNNAFDAATYDHGIRKSLLRIIDNTAHTGNPSPPYPAAINNAEGLGDTTKTYLYGRRTLFYTGNPTLNNLSIPAAQPISPTGLTIEYVEANPASGNQEQEFFIIRNNSANYVDISGWKIAGAVDFTFRGGTVIPPFTGNATYNATGDVHTGRLHVARNPYLFRQRTVSPKGGEYRLVTGPYAGQLSARGETLKLVMPGPTPASDVTIATTTYTGAPTAAQNFLRITELNYNPTAPTAAESAALPGVAASDFEFIEFLNTGKAPLNIGGAQIDKGVTFTFPSNFTLQPGQRCVVVSLLAAYNLRYGAAGVLVAGQCEGNLSNSGETIRVLDNVGESILQFTYDPLWFGVPRAGNPGTLTGEQAYSLVTRSSNPAWDGYEQPTVWALSDVAGGSPGAGDSSFANVFTGWTKSFFTPTGEATPTYGGPAADPDNDGRSNFEEYMFGGNPLVAETTPLPVSSIVSVQGTDYLAITFDRRHHTIDATCVVQASGDLADWTTVDLPVETPLNLGGGMDRVTYRDSQPLSTGQRFLRVRATR